MQEFTSKVDHINPRDWRGDVSVLNVNLHTCWLLGRKQAAELNPDMEAALGALTRTDMLSPLGTLLVNQRHETVIETEDPSDENDGLDVLNQDPGEDHLTLPSIPYTHEGDLEDMIADELPHNKSTSEIFIQGEKTTKAKALRHRVADHASWSSTDRLKHVQQLPCFDVANRMAETDIITTGDSPLGTPSLHVGSPVALLVRCEGLMVLAITQVNRIRFASRDLDGLPAHLLADPTARIDSQILCLIPATLNDDPTQVHDWCWSLNMEVQYHATMSLAKTYTPSTPQSQFKSWEVQHSFSRAHFWSHCHALFSKNLGHNTRKTFPWSSEQNIFRTGIQVRRHHHLSSSLLGGNSHAFSHYLQERHVLCAKRRATRLLTLMVTQIAPDVGRL